MDISENERHIADGLTALRKKEFELALQHFSSIVETNPSAPDGYRLRGDTFWEMGQLENALREYELAGQQDSGDSRLHFNCGSVLFALDRFADAAVAFSEAMRLAGGKR